MGKRLCIYPLDVCIILGSSVRHARRLLKDIRAAYKKEEHQYVTFKEFSEYTDIPLEEIRKLSLK